MVPLASEVVALAAKWVRENVAPRAEVDFRRAFDWVERSEALEQHLAYMGPPPPAVNAPLPQMAVTIEPGPAHPPVASIAADANWNPLSVPEQRD